MSAFACSFNREEAQRCDFNIVHVEYVEDAALKYIQETIPMFVTPGNWVVYVRDANRSLHAVSVKVAINITHTWEP